MIESRRVIALVPARGGSKSVPYKNLHLLGAKPLIAWPIDCARSTSEIDRTIVSTDDAKIAAEAKRLGAEVYERSAALASDTAIVADVIRDLWRRLRSEADINPERTWRIEGGVPRPFIDGAVAWKPRQQLTPAYQLNGAVYAFFPDRLAERTPGLLFGAMGAEIVPADAVIDIDTAQDFVIADALLKR